MLGDRHSQAIIDLQLSTTLLPRNRLDGSNKMFVRGMAIVEVLGEGEIAAGAARY